jgi:hypothetical protein
VSVAIGGDSDAAALASKVDSLEAAFNSHTHVTTATVGATATVATIAPTTGTSNETPFASAKLLLGG